MPLNWASLSPLGWPVVKVSTAAVKTCGVVEPATISPGTPFTSSFSSTAMGCEKDSWCTGCFGPGVTAISSWYLFRVRWSGLMLSGVMTIGQPSNPFCLKTWKPSVPQFSMTQTPPSSPSSRRKRKFLRDSSRAPRLRLPPPPCGRPPCSPTWISRWRGHQGGGPATKWGTNMSSA